MSPRTLDTPTAIIVAGALVGAGLFLGLRGRSVEPAAAPATTALRPSEPAPARVPDAPQPQAQAPALAVLVEQAKRALEPQRASLVEKCWAPAIKTQPAPPEITYVFNFNFDAQGHQITRGVVEDRRTARPLVTRCVTQTLTPIEIPAPGVAVHLEVPFALP